MHDHLFRPVRVYEAAFRAVDEFIEPLAYWMFMAI